MVTHTSRSIQFESASVLLLAVTNIISLYQMVQHFWKRKKDVPCMEIKAFAIMAIGISLLSALLYSSILNGSIFGYNGFFEYGNSCEIWIRILGILFSLSRCVYFVSLIFQNRDILFVQTLDQVFRTLLFIIPIEIFLYRITYGIQ